MRCRLRRHWLTEDLPVLDADAVLALVTIPARRGRSGCTPRHEELGSPWEEIGARADGLQSAEACCGVIES